MRFVQNESHAKKYVQYVDVHPNDWTQRQRIQFLLDHWPDIFEPNIASSLSTAGGGSGLEPRLPKMAEHGSVRELTRCLDNLARDDPAAHRHLKAFRCNAEWRQVKAKIKFLGPKGNLIEGDGWRRERIIPSWINARLVLRAEEAIVRMFRDEVFIPKDLWDGITKPVSS